MSSTAYRPDITPVLDAVGRYGVLDEPPRPELQAIVALAAQVCRTPMATLSVLTTGELHHVAAFGIDPVVCRREDSLCHHVLSEPTPVVVPDCSLDVRLKDTPFVNGERAAVRFYASHHLVTPAGITIGTLCVYDVIPRDLHHEQVSALATLAARVVDVLELSVQSQALTTANERLAAFAGQVSHDLKTPLASLTMALGLAREDLDSAEAVDRGSLLSLVDRALRGTWRMDALIDEVLDHALGSGAGERAPVDLDAVVDDVLDDLASCLTDARVVRSPLPTVPGNRTGLRELVQNLVDNSAKHRHPDRDLVVTIGAVRRPGAWRVCVTDNGPGIPAAERERIFEPRTRLDQGVPGSGIGLDTCRRVASEHRGRMGVSDGPDGVGACVWFEVPDRPDVPRLWPVPSA